jgi:predicted peptidase
MAQFSRKVLLEAASSAGLGAACTIGAFLVFPAILAADSWQEAYKYKTHRDADGQTLPYRLLSPKRVEPDKKYPLVLFLHGAGERGTDNSKQLTQGAGEFAKPENRGPYPCFVVAPQCPPNCRWVEVSWTLRSHTMPEKPSAPMKLALELVEKLAADLPVDTDRIYVTGLSMGGYGAWDAIQRRPELFAAAIPICGGGDTAQAPKLKSIPIWAFHGDKDPTVPVRRTTDMIEAVARAGGSPKMTIYSGIAHNCWTATYANPKVLVWLFAQKK